jgi:hypothetical protein
MDELTKAIIAAGDELEKEHGWDVWEDYVGSPKSDGTFCTVIRKNLMPLIDMDALKAAKIKALRAELAALEST